MAWSRQHITKQTALTSGLKSLASIITNPTTQSKDNNHNRFNHTLIYFSFPGHINMFLGQESHLTLHIFYLEPVTSSKMFNTSIATGTHPAVSLVYWLWSLMKIQVPWRALKSTKCPCPTNSKEFSLLCSFVMMLSTARKAAKQWDNGEQHTTCYSTQAWETRSKKKRGGTRAWVQLQAEASGSQQRIGCREELRACRRLVGTDKKTHQKWQISGFLYTSHVTSFCFSGVRTILSYSE